MRSYDATRLPRTVCAFGTLSFLTCSPSVKGKVRMRAMDLFPFQSWFTAFKMQVTGGRELIIELLSVNDLVLCCS